MQQVYRQEHKFLMNLLDSKKQMYYISNFLEQDKHNGETGYQIRSLYFDTLEDNDFFEKEEGIEIRKKMRLRLYNSNDDFAMLEMKQKKGMEQLKRSLKIKREDAKSMTKGAYSVLLKYKEPFAAECFAVLNLQGYRPKTIVEYTRKAFIAKENKTRITFDSNIIATESSFDLFSGQLMMYPVLPQNRVVLEVKYDGFLPSYIQEMIKNCNQTSESVSKYCLGRTVSLNYLF